MKNSIIAAIFLLASIHHLKAQDSLTQEIDRQVWEPFISSYNARNAEAYLALHTEDVLRINPGNLQLGDEYRMGIREGFSGKDYPDRTIDLRFEHRMHRAEVGYEVGYYRIRYKDREEAHYGRFHVLLRKIDGRWKIAQDWDTSEVNGRQVIAEDFDRLK